MARTRWAGWCTHGSRVVEASVRTAVEVLTGFIDVTRVDGLQCFHTSLAIVLKESNVSLASRDSRICSYDSQVSPVQQVTQSFCSVPLNDALTSVQFREIVHVLSELLNGVLEPDVSTINDVDSVRLRVSDVFLHEATEARQICGDTRNSHDGAFCWCVTPRFIVRRENTYN